ncbi:hypothetical protein EUX98_g9437 [Antrodiella citrinella]|uniref:Uncharacterized protein n=1 Tax=Antrodiella citrinella TaxID=2447956 RepID=A0A4S4LYW0_9APHY|nr:hypothetical protein EUX98_g9437 [Antrodiella citrinella]
MNSLPKDDVIILMGVPAVRPPLEISYEEQRIQDYLKAFQTTGRPPLPVPETPTDATQRLALGLPPLFEPYVEKPIVNVVKLEDTPEAQVFRPMKMDEGAGSSSQVVFQTIVMQKEFCYFSHEELRYHAYRTGRRNPPESITPELSLLPALPAPVTPLAPRPPLARTATTSLLTINDSPEHSFEELRLAYILLGREATSDEIRQQNSVIRLTV